jgi:dimeric dUTPase (all-alpha-NTP-PPase superfamily)
MEKNKIDKLDIIFEKQLELQVFLDEIKNYPPSEIVQEKIDKTILCIIDELFELLRGTNYKYWRINKNINIDYLKKEYIDIFKFVLNLGLHLGITSDELFNEFNRKTKLNYFRLENENGEDFKDD